MDALTPGGPGPLAGDSPDNPILTVAEGDDWGFRFVQCGGCGIVERCTPRYDFFLEGDAESGPLYCEGCLYRRRAAPDGTVEIPAWMLAPPVRADRPSEDDVHDDTEDDGIECRFCDDLSAHACVADVYGPGGVRLRAYVETRGGPPKLRDVDPDEPEIEVPACLGCGCIDESACPEGCYWAFGAALEITVEGEPLELEGLVCSACVHHFEGGE